MKFSNFVFFIFISLLISTLLVSPTDAKVYKWKDENGKTHYTDSPDKIPFKFRPKIQMRFRITSCHEPIPEVTKKKLEEIGNGIAKGKFQLKRDHKILSKMSRSSLEYYKFKTFVLKLEVLVKENEIKFSTLILKYGCNTEKLSSN